MKERALRFKHSQSLASLRQRLSQAMVRSAPDPIRGPSPGQHDEAFGLIGAFDDFDVELGDCLLSAALEDIPAVTAVGIELEQKRVEAEERRHHQHTAIAVLDAGMMHEAMQQEALGIDENVPLLALDLLARIVSGRVRGPPFSALFTLWLSMIAAVGEASRPTASRHST